MLTLEELQTESERVGEAASVFAETEGRRRRVQLARSRSMSLMRRALTWTLTTSETPVTSTAAPTAARRTGACHSCRGSWPLVAWKLKATWLREQLRKAKAFDHQGHHAS